jgi:thymidine kinase
MSQPQVGRIEVITGPMFSGKSEELIRRLKRALIAKLRVRCFKPGIDARYHDSAIASHSQMTIAAVPVKDVYAIADIVMPNLDSFDVIGIDEAQFFDGSIVDFVNLLVRANKRVVIAGLDTTFEGIPFAPVPDLMAIADEVLKLSAICIRCGKNAIHTQRLSASKERVQVGTVGVYEARCRSCFEPAYDPSKNIPGAELAIP